MQKGGEGVQIACKIAYVLNGRPLCIKEKEIQKSTRNSEMYIYMLNTCVSNYTIMQR